MPTAVGFSVRISCSLALHSVSTVVGDDRILMYSAGTTLYDCANMEYNSIASSLTSIKHEDSVFGSRICRLNSGQKNDRGD